MQPTKKKPFHLFRGSKTESSLPEDSASEPTPSGASESGPDSGSTLHSANDTEDDRLLKAQEELLLATGQFKENYERFGLKYHLHLTEDEPIRAAIQNTDKFPEIRESARFFGKEISNVIRITQQKQKISDTKWTGIVSNFLSKIYPLTWLCVHLASSISEVPDIKTILIIRGQVLSH